MPPRAYYLLNLLLKILKPHWRHPERPVAKDSIDIEQKFHASCHLRYPQNIVSIQPRAEYRDKCQRELSQPPSITVKI